MARQSGIISQIFQNIRRTLAVRKHEKTSPAIFVGSDPFGNKYFERKGDAAQSIKNNRWVEAANPDPMLMPDVPIEWDAWLRGRQVSPPTKEQLERTRQLVEKNMNGGQSGDSKVGSFPAYDDYEVEPGQHEEKKK